MSQAEVASAVSATSPDTSAPSDGAAVELNGEAFSAADVAFYGLMLRLDALRQDTELTENELKRLGNVNLHLNHLIELEAMRMLAQEKGWTPTADQIAQTRQEYLGSLEGQPELQQQIDEYGRDRFQVRLDEYLGAWLMRARVIEELKVQQQKEHPEYGERELDFAVRDAYDLLYQDHLKDLNLKLHPEHLKDKGEATSKTVIIVPPDAPAAAPLPVRDGQVAKVDGLRQLKGLTIVNFWATWCGPCREELPLLAEVARSGEIDVLTVNLDESPTKVQNFLAELGLSTLPTVYARQSELKGWNIPGLPTSYLVSEDSRIVDQQFGPLNRRMDWFDGLWE